jgi:hypothetical protein
LKVGVVDEVGVVVELDEIEGGGLAEYDYIQENQQYYRVGVAHGSHATGWMFAIQAGFRSIP